MGVKFCERTGAWLDGYLITWMDKLIEAVKANWDSYVLIDGVEGSGKSSLAFTLAYYVDRSFNVDNIVFTPEQFIKAVDKAKPHTAIVWDEFVMGGLGDDAMKSIQTTIIKKMVTMRKKNLYLFLVIPYIFMLRTYFAVGRSRMLVHVYSPDGVSRGKWKLYNYQRKKDLYFKGKKFFEYRVPQTLNGDFGRYDNWGFIDDEEYQKKKDNAIASLSLIDKGVRETKLRDRIIKLLGWIKSEGYVVETIYKYTRIPRTSIRDYIREYDGSSGDKTYIKDTVTNGDGKVKEDEA